MDFIIENDNLNNFWYIIGKNVWDFEKTQGFWGKSPHGFKQVKAGFTNYQPRGLAKQILNFKQNQKLKNDLTTFKNLHFLNFEKNLKLKKIQDLFKIWLKLIKILIICKN